MINEAIDFVKEIFAGDGSGHDFDHTMRVYRMALKIAEREGAAVKVVSLAALLHDVDDRKISPETCEKKERAVSFLRKNGADEELVGQVVQAISEISFSEGNGKPSTLEGMCVQDADRLDAIGAIGIARAFAFGGSRNRRMYDPEGLDQGSTIQHFYDKLLKLKDRMNTAAGKELAVQRDAWLRAFLEEFYAEAEGSR